ncbi:retrovirus-related Pol polyprotein from transposon 297 [Trichonephila clavipes]|nr:retrovirus-related Pol polyprotein from transposon 297 [Trichonephila clavipes]
MVWAGITINGRTRVHVVANGTMTGQRYIDEVLLPHVRLFRGAVGDKFVFMDDNATCHRTLADALGRQVAGRNYPPTNKNTLIRALTEEWDKLPQQLLDNVVQSMHTDNSDDSGESNDKIGYGNDSSASFQRAQVVRDFFAFDIVIQVLHLKWSENTSLPLMKLKEEEKMKETTTIHQPVSASAQ